MLEAGFQIGHYRILRMLGSGGMADVYEAEDGKLGRRVALKILPPELARNPELITRFDTEVRAAALLNHRNIVTVFEVGHQDSYHYYSMRLLTGGDLRKRIAQGLTPLEAVAILRELADAFVHAHGSGFVHRDVKPENVIFDEQGMPVLTDFGIAKALEKGTSLTGTGVAVGTPRYISPEQARGMPVDTRADLYSLGVVFYEMLTGRPPYEAEESLAVILKHVSEPIPKLPPELSILQPLIDRLMAKEPGGRLGTAQELLQTLDDLDTSALAAVSPVKQSRSAPLQKLLTTPAARKPASPPAPVQAPAPAPVAAVAAKGAADAVVAQRSKIPVYALAATMAVVAVAGAAWYLGFGPIQAVDVPSEPDHQEPIVPVVIESEPPAAPVPVPAFSEPAPIDDAAALEAAAEAQRREQLRRQAQEEEARRTAEARAKREEEERQRAAAAAKKQQEEDARREQVRKEELRRQEEEQRAAEEAEARRREEERRRQLERELEEDLERQFD